MSFDIYGDRLERGHCEVHPWVHEEYPCTICLQERERKKAEKRAEREYYTQMEKDHYISMCENVNGAGI